MILLAHSTMPSDSQWMQPAHVIKRDPQRGPVEHPNEPVEQEESAQTFIRRRKSEPALRRRSWPTCSNDGPCCREIESWPDRGAEPAEPSAEDREGSLSTVPPRHATIGLL